VKATWLSGTRWWNPASHSFTDSSCRRIANFSRCEVTQSLKHCDRELEPASTVEDFLRIVPCPSKTRNPWVYRGVSSHNFTLTPSFFRLDPIAKLISCGDIGSVREAHAAAIERFVDDCRPYVQPGHLNRGWFEWESLAQHYGHPTTLLDWTTNPLIALFFAVRDALPGSKPDQDAVVWCLGRNPCLKQEDDFLLMQAKLIDPRMQSQCAFHTTHLRGVNPFVAPLESNKSIEGFDLLSIRIPKIEKTSILYRLYLLGIHEASIFPGFTGIAAKARFEILLYPDRIPGDAGLGTTSTTSSTTTTEVPTTPAEPSGLESIPDQQCVDRIWFPGPDLCRPDVLGGGT
jgi:hypothetical protein